MFVDLARIRIRAGKGGDGAVSFHREKYVAAGGPDGGDGGKGGDVVFVADTNLSSLINFKYKTKYYAGDGQNGGTKRCTGKNAPDLVVRVPKGTLVREAKTGRLIADLSGTRRPSPPRAAKEAGATRALRLRPGRSRASRSPAFRAKSLTSSWSSSSSPTSA